MGMLVSTTWRSQWWCKITLMDKIPIFGRNEVAKHDCKGEIEHKLKLKELSLK
jgi:hypothetical protein